MTRAPDSGGFAAASAIQFVRVAAPRGRMCIAGSLDFIGKDVWALPRWARREAS